MFDRLYNITRFIGVLLLGGIALLSAVQIIFRYFLDASISWSNDFNQLMMMWMVMIGAGGMLWKRSHFTLTIVVEKLPKRIQNLLRIVVYIAIAIFAIFLIATGTQLASKADQIVPALGIAYFYVYLAMPVGALFIFLFSLGLVLKEMKK